MAGKGGIGRYIGQLVARLPVEALSFSAPVYSLNEQLAFPWSVPPCDLFWSPHFNAPLLPIRAKKRVVTLHDLYHLDQLAQFSWCRRLGVKWLISSALRRADLVITVSNFSKRRLLHHFPQVSVEVIPLGGDHLVGIEPIAVKLVHQPFFLFVGSHKPHKNRKLLDGLPIVDAMGQYSEGELVWLYSQAEALIFPSLYEGFGLPPLEAMSLGCPVIASRAASIPEVCGSAALYFDPHSRDSLAEAISRLPREREELIAKGKERARRLTWRLCAQRHMELIRDCL